MPVGDTCSHHPKVFSGHPARPATRGGWRSAARRCAGTFIETPPHPPAGGETTRRFTAHAKKKGGSRRPLLPVTGCPGLSPCLTPTENRVEPLEIVDDAPFLRAGALYTLLPGVEAAEIASRIDVVRVELGHVDRHHPDVLQVDREVADRHLVDFFLHVGEDKDRLPPGAGLLQELRALDHAAGYVGVDAALHRAEKRRGLVTEGALLRVGLRRAGIKRNLGDDILL